MKQPSSIILLLLLQMLFFSCKKNSGELSFATPTHKYDLAVEGGMNTANTNQFIRLSKPASHPDSLPRPIRKAVVTVNDGKKDMAFRETNTPGVYSAPKIAEPNYNQAYTLTIRYNNQTYTAVDTLRQVVNIIDDFLPLSITKTTDGKYNGTIPKHTFGYLNPNKWWISYPGVPAWSTEKFDQAQYYNYTHLLGSPNSLYPLTNLKRTFNLSAEDIIVISKMSISRAYARYLYGVFLETDWKGLFSSVPVNVDGNISGNAQGYFFMSDVDRRGYRVRELK